MKSTAERIGLARLYTSGESCQDAGTGCRDVYTNSSKGGGGGFWPKFFKGGGVRVQVRGNVHILTNKQNKPLRGGGGGLNPLTPPPLDPQLGWIIKR